MNDVMLRMAAEAGEAFQVARAKEAAQRERVRDAVAAAVTAGVPDATVRKLAAGVWKRFLVSARPLSLSAVNTLMAEVKRRLAETEAETDESYRAFADDATERLTEACRELVTITDEMRRCRGRLAESLYLASRKHSPESIIEVSTVARQTYYDLTARYQEYNRLEKAMRRTPNLLDRDALDDDIAPIMLGQDGRNFQILVIDQDYLDDARDRMAEAGYQFDGTADPWTPLKPISGCSSRGR